jgi:pimeloyl-ACP methyl ester carboxylesterase
VIGNNETVVTDEMMLPVNGIEVCAEAFGERTDPAVLLIGGATSSMDWWDDEFCRRLAAGGRYVIRYDHRDTGRSTSFPAGEPPYSGVDLAHDALGVLDALQVHRAHLVGMSMGGILAQRIAVSRPHRVLSLTLMSTTAGLPEPDTTPGPSTAPEADGPNTDGPNTDGPEADGPEADGPEADGPEADGPEADGPEAGGPDWTNRRVAVDRIAEAVRALGGAFTADEPQVRRFAQRVLDRTNDMAACQANHYLAEPGPPFRDRLATIKAPTLILHGTQDPLFDRSHAETLAAEIPGARIVWLEGVGHEYPPNAVWPTVLEAILAQGR